MPDAPDPTRQYTDRSTVDRQFGWKRRLDGARTEVSVSAGPERSTLRVRIEMDEVALVARARDMAGEAKPA